MLVQFSVANYLSFKEKVTLSLVASNEKGHLGNTFEVAEPTPMRLLKSVAVYGANASGKSNLLKAMWFAAKFVLGSATERPSVENTHVVPFKLDSATEQEPSLFEFAFIKDAKLYVYGFTADAERVHEEWLTVMPKGAQRTRPRTLFQREPGTRVASKRGWGPGTKALSERTRDNALFISVAAQFNNPVAKSVVAWFAEGFKGISNTPERRSEATFTAKRLRDRDDFAGRFSGFVDAADVGIERVKHTLRRWDEKTVQDFAATAAGELGITEAEAKQVMDLIRAGDAESVTLLDRKSVHRRADGTEVEFDFDREESAGTQRLVSMAGPWDYATRDGCVLTVDELDTRLHPLMTRFLIGQIHQAKQAQLIFTTHDCGLLDADLFRRDQIWFTEKNAEGATCLYSLSDFEVRQETNIRKRYLSGRYGAIPFVGEFSFAEEQQASEG